MAISDDRSRRPPTVIQWHDSPTRRTRSMFGEDGAPYRALGLAAVLGILSMLAVFAALQFHRQGELPAVGNLVEEARAETEAPAKAPVVENAVVPKKSAVVTTAAVTMQPAAAVAAEATQLQPAGRTGEQAVPQPVSSDASPQPESVEIASANQTRAAASPSADAAPLPTDNPRWLSADEKVQAAIDDTSMGSIADQPLALAPALPDVGVITPTPKPAKDKPKVLAALDKSTKRAVANEPKQTADSGARIRRSVFLRARPSDGGAVLTTIPSGANVKVASNCRHWCSVTYQGKTGFVYKSFISR